MELLHQHFFADMKESELERMDLLLSVGGSLVWRIQEDWPLESAKHVLQKRLKCRNEHGRCHLECDRCINVCRAQTGVTLLSQECVN